MTHPHLQKILSELHTGLVAIYGDQLDDVILFGSQAREDAAQDSDIDIMVVLHGDEEPSIDQPLADDLFYKLCWDYDTVVLPIYVSSHTYQTMNSPLMMNVRREGRIHAINYITAD